MSGDPAAGGEEENNRIYYVVDLDRIKHCTCEKSKKEYD